MSPSSSSRWSPTSEQLMILEEMYRGGVRTPNAVQIQQITTHLSMYGKIEGKNVFYWFQNHKARDRQRLRRKLLSAASRQHQPPPPPHHHQQQNQLCHQQPSQPHQHYLLGCNGCTPPPLPTCVGGAFEYHNYPSYDQTRDDLTKSTMMSLYGRDWMAAMVDVGPTTSPAPCHRPLKTLELFPLTTSTDRPKKY